VTEHAPIAPSPRSDPSPALVAAAIAVGRLPGEPAAILEVRTRPQLLSSLFGLRTRRPLSDPRLEILRAISASLTRGVARIGADLVAAAHRTGWTDDDLRRTFPGIALDPAA
jgi:hypothetical protein